MKFKYFLDKTSKKFICPACSKKRLVRYLDTEFNSYLSEEYGRCDRETSCGYHLPPASNPTIVNSQPIEVAKSVSTIDNKYVNATITRYNENNLFQYLIKHFNTEEVIKNFKKYRIGTSKLWQGATVFWQIDRYNNARSGKIMLLNLENGKRIKKPFPHINWVHKVLKLKNFNLKQCLFGEHLLQQITASTTIAVVESEKTAITMSLFVRNHTWVATGSKQNLKASMLLPLKKHKLVLFPDCGEYRDWQEKAKELNKQGYDIKCSSVLEDKDYAQGSDLADVYFEINNIEKLNIKEHLHLSSFEEQVKEVATRHPSLLTLIERFDLIDEKGGGIRTELLRHF